MRLTRSLKKGGKVDVCQVWLPALSHGEEIAEQPVEASDLLQDRLQRCCPASVIASRQGVFSFEPHRRNRVADFMSEAGGKPANSGQPLGSTGAPALVRETRSRGVQGIHQPIQFALAGSRQCRKFGRVRIAAGQLSFQANELARPQIKDARKPDG